MATVAIPLLFVLPLLACLLFGAFAKLKLSAHYKTLGLGFSLVYCFLGAYLLCLASGGETLVYSFADWPYPAAIVYVVDRLSATMIALAGLSAVLVHLVGPFSKLNSGRAGNWILLHGMQAGIHSAFLTGDFFNLFVAFELFLIFSYGLVLSNTARASASTAYLYLNILASSLLLLAEGVLYGTQGSLNMAELSGIFAGQELNWINRSIFLMFAVVALLKAGAAPFFQWLPHTYSQLPAGLGAYFSALLTKVGIYLLLRLGLTIMPDQANAMAEPILWIGVGSIFIGVIAALGQKEMKKLLAFHTVSQIGYILVGVSVAFLLLLENPFISQMAIVGVLIYILHHSLVKSSLFAVAGALDLAGGSSKLQASRGYLKEIPWIAYCFLAAGVSLAGMPPSSGFLAKFTLVKGVAAAGYYGILAALILGGILTLASMLKIWLYTMTGPSKGVQVNSSVLSYKWPLIFFVASSWVLVACYQPLMDWTTAAAVQLTNPEEYRRSVSGQSMKVLRGDEL